MSTRSTSNELVSPFSNPERVVRNRQRNRGDPSLLLDFEDINMNLNNQGPPLVGPIPPPIPQNHGPPGPNLHNPALDLRTMEKLCQSTMNGRGGPIAPVNIQAMDFELKNHMIQQSIKQNGVIDDALRLLPFLIFDTSATALGLILRNDISNFRQLPDESLFEAWECYKLSIDRYPNHNMLPVTQIDTFYNGLTWRHRDIINAAAGARPSVPPPPPYSSKEVERDPKTITDQIPERNPHQPHIPYPSRLNKKKLQDKSDIQIHKLAADTLTNKEKLLELANTPLNDNCSAVLLRKLPEKLGDPGKFLIPCDFSKLEECLALADLGASINLMPLSVWKKLMLPELIPTRMTLELANRSVAYPVGIAEDVFVQVGKFTFPADFVVIDYDVDPRVPLILGRPFLRTAHALVDVHGEELTLRVGDEKLIFNVESTLKYPHKHGDESINQIDIIDTTCEDHFHKVLNVQKLIHPLSGSATPSNHVVSSLTPFGDSDFLLEEIDAFLALDDSIPPEIDNGIYDSEGDILFLEKLLNDDPTKDLPPKELKNDETKMTKSSIEEPPELELKDLPPHLEYAFLEGTSKLPVIIAKDLKRVERISLLRLKIFSGKLKSRWSGPFTITEVFPYGTVELSQPNSPNFKVNGHRIKHYHRGDIPALDVPDLRLFPMNN
ncbi:reverse transcriptase domain-containing protein [Tanacetum coccineum]